MNTGKLTTLMATLTLAASLFAQSVLAQADITDHCLRPDFECVSPVLGNWVFTRSSSSAVFSSIDAVVSDIESKLAGQNCSPKPTATALVTESEMPFCDNIGSGNELYPGCCDIKCAWSLSTTVRALEWDAIEINGYSAGNCGRPTKSYRDLLKRRTVTCPQGFEPFTKSTTSADVSKGSAICGRWINPPVENCQDSVTVGNPCVVSSGAKVMSELDISSNGLEFRRLYNSKNLSNRGFGKGWHIDGLLKMSLKLGSGYEYYTIDIGGGNIVQFRYSPPSGDWEQTLGSNRKKYNLTKDDSGFVLTSTGAREFKFDQFGRLLEEHNRSGLVFSYEYNNLNLVTKITNRYGQALEFSYQDNGLIDSIVDPTGASTMYQFDDNRNLISVAYPNDELDGNENLTKIYHYEDPNFVNHLTGVSDENGDRYATYEYSNTGRAISTEHAETTNNIGQEKVALDYD